VLALARRSSRTPSVRASNSDRASPPWRPVRRNGQTKLTALADHPAGLSVGPATLSSTRAGTSFGAGQGSPRHARNSLAPDQSSQVPAIASIWFTGRRSAQIRSRSPRATGHWRAVRWIDHRLDPAHGQSASFSNKTDPPRTPGNDRQPQPRGTGRRIARPVRLVSNGRLECTKTADMCSRNQQCLLNQ
jgi:hypothetical protein